MERYCKCFICCCTFTCGRVCSCTCPTFTIACGQGLWNLECCCLEQGYKKDGGAGQEPDAKSLCFCNCLLCGWKCGRYSEEPVAGSGSGSGGGFQSVGGQGTLLEPPRDVVMTAGGGVQLQPTVSLNVDAGSIGSADN